MILRYDGPVGLLTLNLKTDTRNGGAMTLDVTSARQVQIPSRLHPDPPHARVRRDPVSTPTVLYRTSTRQSILTGRARWYLRRLLTRGGSTPSPVGSPSPEPSLPRLCPPPFPLPPPLPLSPPERRCGRSSLVEPRVSLETLTTPQSLGSYKGFLSLIPY